MELKVQSVFYGTATLRIVKDNFVDGVLVIGGSILVPSPSRRGSLFVTFKLILHWRHLIFAHRKHKPFDFQATMVVDGVKIGRLTILIINRAMESIGFSLTNTWVDKSGVIGRIHGQIESDNTVAAVTTMVDIHLLARLVIGCAIKQITLTVTNVFGDECFIINGPIIQMQVQGLVAAKLGLKMMFIYAWITHLLAIKIKSAVGANGLIGILRFIGMNDNCNANILRTIIIADMASVGGGAHFRRGHRMLRSRVVKGVGGGPIEPIVAHAARRQSMEHGISTFAKLGVVGGSHRRHTPYRYRAFWSAQQHEFAKRDVIKAKVITATHRVLIQYGDGSGCGVTAIPKLIELKPFTSIWRCGEHFAQLNAIDAKLKAGHISSRTNRANPCRKSVIGIRRHGDLFRPDVGIRARSAIDYHKITRPSVTCSYKIGVEISSVGSHTIGAFRIKVGGIGVCGGKTCVALFEISVEHAFGTRTIARAGVSRRDHRRCHGNRAIRCRKASRRRPNIIQGSRGGKCHRLSRLNDSRRRRNHHWLRHSPRGQQQHYCHQQKPSIHPF